MFSPTKYLYRKFVPEHHLLVDWKKFDLISKDGIRFYLDDTAASMVLSPEDYDYSGITNESIVMDIGANVGAFTMRAARIARQVYAFEPVMFEQLKKNVRQYSNIQTFKVALGNTGTGRIVWGGESSISDVRSFKSILSVCGGRIDFLKCDCEGGEWSIPPELLSGISRLEMELHGNSREIFNSQLVSYITKHYQVKFTYIDEKSLVLHAYS